MPTIPTNIGSSSLSALQENILRMVCTRDNVTYKMLIEETHRDRITILQSVNSLIKQNYITKQKEHPEHEKSKLTFKPTHSGKQVAVFRMKVSLEEILIAEKDKDISSYFNVIKDITDATQRDLFVLPLERLLTLPITIDTEIRRRQIRKNILKEALKKGLQEAVQNQDYNASSLVNERSLRRLKELLSPTEIRHLKNSLSITRNNLTETIEKLPS